MKLDPDRARAALENRLREMSTSSATTHKEERPADVYIPARLGAVRLPTEDERCQAVSERTSNRCQRYAQAGSSLCSKHAPRLVAGEETSRIGSVKPLKAEGDRVVSPDSPEDLRGLAVSELRKLLESPSTQDAVKVQAARAVRDLQGAAGPDDRYAELHEWRQLLSVLRPEDRLAYLREVSGVGLGTGPS